MDRTHGTSAERGIAMIVTLLALLVLSSLGVSIVFLTNTEQWTATNFKMLTQARYTAEAGLQKSLNWMIYNYTQPSVFTDFDMTASPVQYGGSPVILSASSSTTSNYPASSVSSAFFSALNGQSIGGLSGAASYTVTAELQSMRTVTSIGGAVSPVQLWRVTSVGAIDSARDAEVEIVANLERIATPIFTYAAFGTAAQCSGVNLGGGATTDSFDSSLGSYATTATSSGGDIGSNGGVRLDGSSTDVNGAVASPNSGTGNCASGSMTALDASNGAQYSSITQLPAEQTFETPAAPDPLPPTTSQNSSNSNPCGNGATAIGAGCTESGGEAYLAAGSYGNLRANQSVIHLTAGTYVLNSIELTGGATLQIDSGPVIIKLAGEALSGNPGKVLDMAGGAVISNALNSAKDLQIIYAGTANVELNGGASAFGVVYAPNANIVMHGSSDWYGSLIGKTVDASGGIQIHYDRSLNDDFYTVGNFRPLFFSWRKY